jgi:glycosyltransferase involved in cell wall biosynthesis
VRIGFGSTDWGDHVEGQPGGCTHMRAMLPAHGLSQIGHQLMVGEIGWKDGEGFVIVPPIERLKNQHREIIKTYDQCFDKLDVIILKLYMHQDAVSYIKKAQAYGQTVIIDTDDHFEQLPSDNMAYHTTDPKNNPDNNRKHLIDTYSVADGIITSTKFLEQKALRYNKTVYRVPNSLDPSTFIQRMDFAGNKPTIGWIGIMLWRVDDIKEVGAPLRTVLEQHDLKFHHSGIVLNQPNWFAEAAGFDPERMTGYVGARPAFYSNIFMPIDIGIVPLTNNPFNEAKSNLKGLEYAMSGIPFVASDTQEYRDLADLGCGRIAKKPRDWVRHLEELLDPDVRRAEAEKNFNIAVENFSLFKVKYKWSEAIELIHMKARSQVKQPKPVPKSTGQIGFDPSKFLVAQN